jgi:hypothetical protein
MAPAAEPIPGDNAENVNEPGATQAPGPATPYSAGQQAQNTPSSSRPQISAEDDVAIRAHYRRSLETTERKLYERYGRGLPDTTESS